ncbi:MAG: PAS domain S-box protein [Myxococcota bacterium]
MTTSDGPKPHKLFGENSRMARTCARKDWRATPLGDPDEWSDTLKTVVRMVLDSRLPMTLGWGEEFIQVYNDGYMEILGQKHPEALGRPVRDVYPEAWDDIGPLLQNVYRSGKPTWYEDRPLPLERRGFLEELYFTFSYSPIRDPEGHTLGVLSSAVDSTDHVLARRRLETLRRLDQVPEDATVRKILDEALSHLSHNPADAPACLLYEHGRSEQRFERIGSTGALEHTLPNDEAVNAAISKKLSDLDDGVEMLETAVLEAVEVVDDGRPEVGSWALIRLWDRLDEDEDCLACLLLGLSERLAFEDEYRAFVADIGRVLSDNLRHIRYQEMRLAYAEHRYEALFENALDAKMLTAPDGRILEANPAACELLGYTEEEIRELGRAGLLDTNDERTSAAVRERAKTGRFRGELDLIHRDGHTIPCEVSSQIYRNADGNKRTSIVIRDQRERLEMESNLRQAQKLDVVGKLAGGIAHDFNNLLTAIDASSRFLEDYVKPDTEAAEDVEVIRAATDRAAALTRRLLAFSRQEPVRSTHLDLANVIGEVDAVLRSLISENIEIITQIDPDTRQVYASRQSIEQVILNLVVNARDAMTQGGTLTIELRNRDLEEPGEWIVGQAAPGPGVSISVTDTGRGLPDLDPTQLFEPFFTTKDHGTGLGLATVASIVSDCSGAIRLESEAGRGTTVEVWLPASHPAVEPERGGEPPSEATVALSGRVLLVEDQPLVRKVTAKMLRDAGLEVRVASGGGEAIEIVRETGAGAFDLIVSDVVMPNLGGEQTARRLEELDPGLRFLFVTGYADNMAISLSSNAASQVLLKPFTAQQLLARVEQVMSDERHDAELDVE